MYLDSKEKTKNKYSEIKENISTDSTLTAYSYSFGWQNEKYTEKENVAAPRRSEMLYRCVGCV